MEQISQILSQYSMKSDFQIPYILTEEQELAAIQTKIYSLQDLFSYKARQRGLTDKEIAEILKTKDFSEEYDRQKVLNQINAFTYFEQLEIQGRNERVKSEKIFEEEQKKLHDSQFFFRFMRNSCQRGYGKTFIFKPENELLIKALCFFMAKDERLKTDLGFDLNKGLWVRGDTGLGKTFLVQCLASNKYRPIGMNSMQVVYDSLASEGDYKLVTGKVLCIDDVGTEGEGNPVVNHYGTKLNWFKSFIETRYFNSKVYNNLICSTNCNFDEIEKMYSKRVRSRIAEMFNIIDVTGKDLRKK